MSNEEMIGVSSTTRVRAGPPPIRRMLSSVRSAHSPRSSAACIRCRHSVTEEITAQMLAEIRRLVAQPGAAVEEDETVLVMEAMKPRGHAV